MKPQWIPRRTGQHPRRVGPALLSLLLALSIAGCGVALAATRTPLAAGPVVTITNFTYTGDLTVLPGATITVKNADTAPHTFTAVNGSFTTPTIAPGTSVTVQAPTAEGSYGIKCNIHASMSGTLVVSRNAPSPSPSPSPSSPAPPAMPVITISNFTFGGDLTVRPGALVTVRNLDTVPHTFTAVNGSFTTPVIPAGTSSTFVAPTVTGSYAVKCNIHSFMMGTLVVSTTAPPPSPSTSPSASSAPPPANPVVMIANFAFTGDTRARPGARLSIMNMDTVPHTFTAVNGSFTTPTIMPNTTVTLTLPTAPGTYAIKCNIHSAMMGSFTIVAAR